MSQEFWPLRAFSTCGRDFPHLLFILAFLGHTGAGKAFCGVLSSTWGYLLPPSFLCFSSRKRKVPGTQKSPGIRMIPGQEFPSLRSGISIEKLLGRLRSAHFPCVKPQFSENEKQRVQRPAANWSWKRDLNTRPVVVRKCGLSLISSPQNMGPGFPPGPMFISVFSLIIPTSHPGQYSLQICSEFPPVDF